MSGSRRDLANRLRPLQAGLKRRLARADAVSDLIRAVNSTLDPERVADALVGGVSEWLPAPGWLVLAVDGGGRTRALAARALTPALEIAAQGVGTFVLRSGAVFSATSCAADVDLVSSMGSACRVPDRSA